MRRHAERGFTLIELVLALSIVAVMVTILFGALRVGLRAWQRGEERAGTLQHARSLTQILEQALAGAYTFLGPPDKDTPPQILFKGETDRLAFVTIAPPMPLPGAIDFAAVSLSMDSGAVPALAIREKALPNFDPFEAVQPSVVDPAVTAVRFRYLRDAGGSWEETWDGEQERALPRAVEVTLTVMINGRAEQQPPMTVPIRVTSP